MQALSFAIHIPLVCFGIAFPAMVLFVEWLCLRTGDPLYRTLAQRWSKVMLALFAAGVVTGTILSFEMGLLWPGFMARVRRRLRARLHARGLLLLRRGDLHRDLRLRLGPALAAHALPVRHPRRDRRDHGLADGDLGERVDEQPAGLRAARRRGGRRRARGARCSATPTSGPSSCTCTSPATSSPGCWSPAPTPGAGCTASRSRYVRTALVIPLTIAALAAPVQVVVGDWIARRVAEDQPVKLAALGGTGRDHRGALPCTSAAGTTTARCAGGSRSPGCSRCSPTTTPTRRCRASTSVPPEDRPPVNVVRVAFQLMVAIGLALVALGLWHLYRLVAPAPAAVHAVVLPRGRRGRAALGGGADRGLGDDRGRPPALGRLRGHAHRGGRDRRGGIPVGYATLVVVYAGLIAAVAWILRRLARAPLEIDAEPAPEALEHAG